MATRIPASSGSMRKQPRQARSRATVEAILTAGAQLLAEVGWLKVTTNRVAEIAGVSIGSLYQYFPDKAALVEAITRRHFDEILDVLREIDGCDLSLEARTERLVAGMIRIHGGNPRLHRVLLRDAPASESLQATHALFEAEYLGRYDSFLARAAWRGADRGIAAQILSSAIAGVVHDAAERGTLHSADVRRELISVVLAYVRHRQ
ncbi:TetR family transcriptional regulator [Rhizorhabdus wittichii DC-6]|nr:TetR family transcriptional regulator [Rhizorhabdus wittichii DC-6]